MNIAILSKSDRNGGGASKVAQELQEQLTLLHHQVSHFTKDAITPPRTPLYGNYAKKVYNTLREVGFQELIPFELLNIYKKHKSEPFDIFHFHDLSTAISPLTLKKLAKNNLVIMSVHDCSIVTGGCIYPLECTQYLTACHNCPQRREWPFGKRVDLSSLFHKIKKSMLHNSNIHFITPSKWMADFIYNTGYIKKYPIIISNGVNTKKFQLLNKEIIREELQLPNNRFIILLSSANLNSIFKGVKYAIEVVQKLKKIKPFILLVGTHKKEVSQLLPNVDIYETGYISDDSTLNKYYAAADIFLNTTIADNQPLTLLEVMASGTPNIGFTTGGIPELISQGVNGLLVKRDETSLLAKLILQYYENDIFYTMGLNARKTVEKNHSLELFIQKHLEFYNKLL